MKNEQNEVLITIIKIHADKAVVKVNDELEFSIKVGEEYTMEVGKGLLISIYIQKSSHLPQTKLYTVKVKKLDKQTYMSFFEYLDQLNANRFKKRETDYKRPMYHLTIGYYMAKLKIKKALNV